MHFTRIASLSSPGLGHPTSLVSILSCPMVAAGPWDCARRTSCPAWREDWTTISALAMGTQGAAGTWNRSLQTRWVEWLEVMLLMRPAPPLICTGVALEIALIGAHRAPGHCCGVRVAPTLLEELSTDRQEQEPLLGVHRNKRVFLPRDLCQTAAPTSESGSLASRGAGSPS